jgi:hypothetical protein
MKCCLMKLEIIESSYPAVWKVKTSWYSFLGGRVQMGITILKIHFTAYTKNL